MNTIRSLATLMTFLMIGSAALAATDPRQDPSSFSTLAISETPNKINAGLTPACVAALKTARGVPSDALKKYLILPRNYRGDKTPDGVFYHYTRAEAVRDIVASGRYGELFSYLRRPESGDPFLYIAGDPDSSRDYGPIQIRLTVSTKSPIFVLMKMALYGSRRPDPLNSIDAYIKWWVQFESDRNDILDDVEADVIARTPGLKACEDADVTFSPDTKFPLLVLLALEDARVPLIAYYGTGENWFMLMGEWAADSFEVGAP